ncbi:MAG: tripartite tricarboxylate transporter substrate binding protein [Proteobacteria bacterium]|nr:tripartite tricarboxylate transporter substrate binding protein [Pseudomonadota bacterium]
MPIIRTPSVRLLAVALSLAALATAAEAAYPERPINLIVPFDAGGGTDVMARTFAPYVEKHLGSGASIVIVNKPGAAGLIGYTEVATAKPDGYTIGAFNLPGGITLYIQGTARYSLDSFDPVANLIDDPQMFIVHKNSPFKTMGDLVSYAKASPGVLTIGFGGVGATGHLSLLFVQGLPGLADFKFIIVPFSGGTQTRAALLGQHIAVSNQSVSEMASYAKEGQVRVLGVQSGERSPFLPDTPTLKEQGIDIAYGASRGFLAPKGVDAAILARLSEAIGKAATDSGFRSAAAKNYLTVRYMDHRAYGAYLREDEKRLKALWATKPWR